ncbi:MAG TPA: tRNA (adenosine(37)-N6)-threonylcarbamoyltransferase complex ATPase subunit type 1 TsaE [Candidatus Latescibacteria bacterium]|nr:tRNA (adenosine(37)-N6)-threonylcarbamoyltransferase complex ATPase subunit type 1 TsaE [Candidatus Latescibacterota bacterium]
MRYRLRKRTESPQETQKFGEELAPGLGPGTVVAFFGELGSGKTCLIQGICRGLGVVEPVTSPAFVIINEYQGRLPVYHFDLYRIKSLFELYELGCEEYFYGSGVCLIEWAEKAGDLLPEDSLRVSLRRLAENVREIAVNGNVDIGPYTA